MKTCKGERTLKSIIKSEGERHLTHMWETKIQSKITEKKTKPGV